VKKFYQPLMQKQNEKAAPLALLFARFWHPGKIQIDKEMIE